MSSCTIFFEKLPQVNSELIESIFSQHIPSAQILSENTEDESDELNNLIVRIGELEFIILIMRAAYPKNELKELLKYNYTLTNGEDIVEKQQCHIVVSPMKALPGTGGAIKTAIATTHMAAVVSQLSNIVGVLWSASGIILNVDGFNQAVRAIGEAAHAQSEGKVGGNLLPLNLWVGIRIYRDANHWGARSHGLMPFFNKELDVEPFAEDPQNSAKIISAIITYQFQSGASLNAGQTIDIAGAQYSISNKTDNCIAFKQEALQ